jgi:ribosomal protein S18 acetylase RimI-like enzyme
MNGRGGSAAVAYRARLVAGPIAYRPMRADDLDAVHDVNLRAFDDLDRRLGVEYPGPPPARAAALLRLRHLLATDAGGAWVAERDGAVAGAALALVREGLWGLSLLVTDPGAQSLGVGRELLRLARAHGEGSRGQVILSSSDPRAVRAYARLGLALHPCLSAVGAPRGVAMPEAVRPGGAADLPLTEAVDRTVRGAAHGGDIVAMIEAGHTLLVAPERGYTLVKAGAVKLLAAFDDAAARTLLQGALAHTAAAGERAFVDWISASQPWAFGVCLDAGLELRPGTGCVFLGGEVGPFRPYLPSGAYL